MRGNFGKTCKVKGSARPFAHSLFSYAFALLRSLVCRVSFRRVGELSVLLLPTGASCLDVMARSYVDARMSMSAGGPAIIETDELSSKHAGSTAHVIRLKRIQGMLINYGLHSGAECKTRVVGTLLAPFANPPCRRAFLYGRGRM